MSFSSYPGLRLSVAIHAAVYAVVIAGLWQLQQDVPPATLGNGAPFPWVRTVAWAWGIGLAAHAAVWLGLSRGKGGTRKGKGARR